MEYIIWLGVGLNLSLLKAWLSENKAYVITDIPIRT